MISANDLLITPVIQILGRILLHFVWQGLAVALVLWLLFFIFRTSQVRYVLACTALVVMMLLPVFTGIYVAREQARLEGNRYVLEALANSTAPNANANNAATLEEGVKVVSKPQAAQTANVPTQDTADDTSYLQVTINIDRYLPWLVVSWFVGVVALSIRLLGGLFITQKLRTKHTKAVPSEIEARLESLASQLKLKGVKVLESLSVQVPMVIGWLRPVVLLPTSAISGLSVRQLEMILAHELAHIRRHDYLVNLLQTIIETLFFYHPAVWWVSHKIRETREHCCDDLAVALCGGNKFHYAQALASLDSLRPGSSLAVSNLTVAASGGSLLQRIERLAGRNPQTGGVMNWLVSLMLVLIPWLVLSSSYAQAKLPVQIEQNIDDFVKGRLESWNVPGIQVAVIQDGEMTFNKAYGLADIENSRAMTVDTPIQLGSGSWVVHAIAAMQLVDQGKLKLTDKLSDHLPWVKFKNGEESTITMHQLIFGDSNIPDSVRIVGSQDFTSDRPTNFDGTAQTAEEFIRSLMPNKLYTRFPSGDSDYSYVNNDILLMLILEQVSGVPLEQYVRDNIFTPLKLQAAYDIEKAKSQGLAMGYSATNISDYQENPSREMVANPFMPPAALRVPLGLSMSSQDFAKLLIAILSRDTTLLSSKAWSSFLDSPDAFQYIWGSGGWWGSSGGFGNIGITESSQVFFEIREDQNIAYITMTNYILPTDTNPLYQVLGSVAQSLMLFSDKSALSPTNYTNMTGKNPSPSVIEHLSGTYMSALGPIELFQKGDEFRGKILGYEFKLEGFSSSYMIRSDFEPLNGLLMTNYDDTIRLDGRQFAYRVN